MNNQQKTILFWIGSVFGVVLILFLIVSINKMLNTATTTNTVTFSGEGKVSAKPDIAMFRFSIVTQATTAEAAKNANAKKSNEVVDFLKKSGIADKDVETSGYNVSPNYGYDQPVPMMYPIRTKPPVISQYNVTQSFTVKVRDLDKANTIVDGIVAAGVNEVGNISFEIENPEKLKEQARMLAVADAKKKAQNMESTVGISLGKVVSFTENEYGYPYYTKMMSASPESSDRGTTPALPVGEDEITINVALTYQIK